MTNSLRVNGRVVRIGNSLGILIPKDEVRRHGLKPGDSIELEVEKRANLTELFGSLKSQKTTQQLKDEAREGWSE